jgi:hypothetical protein
VYAQRQEIKVEILGIISPPHYDARLTVILDHEYLNQLRPFSPEKLCVCV